jgi:hypothetical protein
VIVWFKYVTCNRQHNYVSVFIRSNFYPWLWC